MKGYGDVHPKPEFINKSRWFTRDKEDLSICFSIYPFLALHFAVFMSIFRVC